MPYRVLEASGHVSRFTDYMVKDAVDTDKYYRADKLLEARLEDLMAEPGISEARKTELQQSFNMADAWGTCEDIQKELIKYEVKAPETGNDLSAPYNFNLMYPVPIGPAGDQGGFLRPETAQGIFLNFKFCLEQNGGNVPLGICQVGKAFRNEIAPRGGLIRQREFTQAEIEYLVPPGDKQHPKFKNVSDLVIEFFPKDEQMTAKPTVKAKLGDMVKKGKIANETLGFYIGRTYEFLLRAGIRPKHVRFRQHLPTEMAHYACDCWDAEIEFSHGWTECVGIADRSAFDLDAHAKASGTDLKATRKLDVPREVETCELSKKAQGMIGKDFKGDGTGIKEHLATLDKTAQLKLKADGGGSITVNGKSITLEAKHVDYTVKKEMVHTESFTPNVIEPSFGIDRILYAIFEHSYNVREVEGELAPKEEEGKKKGKGKGKEMEKMKRHVLEFKAEIAPFKVAVFPLQMTINRDDRWEALRTRLFAGLNLLGVSSRSDESGVAIGRKYARHDELGVPFAVTIDGKSFEEDTVTLRERDSCAQVRVPIAVVGDEVHKLCNNVKTWSDVAAAYPSVDNTAAAGNATNATTTAPASKAAEIEAYLAQHNLRDVIQQAVSEVVASQAADPIAALTAALAKRK